MAAVLVNKGGIGSATYENYSDSKTVSSKNMIIKRHVTLKN